MPQSQLARGQPERPSRVYPVHICIHPSQRVRGARRWPPGYLSSAWLPDTVSSLQSWPGLREAPGTRGKLRLQDVCTHPLLADKSIGHLPCSGVTSFPSALLGHGLGPTGQPPEPKSPALARESCLCPCPTASQEHGAASRCPSLTPGAGTHCLHLAPWPLGKKNGEKIEILLEGIFRA